MTTPAADALLRRTLLRQLVLRQLPLRLRVALLHASPLLLLSIVLCLAVAGGLLWTTFATIRLETARDALRAQVRAAAADARSHAAAFKPSAFKAAPAQAPMPAPVQAFVPAPAPDNLAAFYATLGQRRHVERELKTLFDLAATNGLTLAQGEYKSGYDRNAHVATYQINLPVKGDYAAIWRFALGALAAIPFASLDDIGFRRDSVGDAQVEARLRLTLYLNAAEGTR